MSDKPEGAGSEIPATGQTAPSKAQAEFDKYKARLGAVYQPQPGMMPPWSAPGGGFPGWALPGGGGPAQPSPGVSSATTVTARLGDTLRLGIELLNATLQAGASALSMGVGGLAAGGMYGPQNQGHGHGCGCPSCCPPSCGCPSCCETLSCQPCCAPGVHGCC